MWQSVLVRSVFIIDKFIFSHVQDSFINLVMLPDIVCERSRSMLNIRGVRLRNRIEVVGFLYEEW